jgi:hypothetical protein
MDPMYFTFGEKSCPPSPALFMTARFAVFRHFCEFFSGFGDPLIERFLPKMD